MTALREIWDDEVAGHYDTHISHARLAEFFKKYSTLDRIAAIEWILFNPIEEGLALRLSIEAKKKVCSAATTLKRDGIPSVFDQEIPCAIDSSGETTSDMRNGFPSWGRIVGGTTADALTIHYARWQ